MTVALPRPRHCRPRSLSDVAALLDLVTPVDLGAPTRDVTGVTLDSRAVRPGDVYAALPGANVHGATFARDALRAGAVAVVTDSDGASRIAAAAAAEPGAEGQGEDGQGEGKQGEAKGVHPATVARNAGRCPAQRHQSTHPSTGLDQSIGARRTAPASNSACGRRSRGLHR